MKRIGNLFDQIVAIDNLSLADKIARRGKSNQYGIQVFDRNRTSNIEFLNKMLISGHYTTSEYTKFIIRDPKEREIFRLPYYPDRIVHHAIMRIMEPIWVNIFTTDTYSCIKERGIHGVANAVKKALKDEANTMFCLKSDVKKFYPSVNHSILKEIIRKKIKDQRLLTLLDEIIDSAPGLPIGNYLSQYLANLYLTYFDHWLKEEKKVRYYFRYCDDIVILAATKEELHSLKLSIKQYLQDNLKLEVKKNHQVFSVDDRGIDFVGYVFRHRYTRLRKSIKKAFARMMTKRRNAKSIASYWGWAKHADTKHLIKTLFREKIQPIQHQTDRKRVYRRQDKDRPIIKPGDSGNRL